MKDIKWQDLCDGKKMLYGNEENFEKSKLAQIQRQSFIDVNKKQKKVETVETFYKQNTMQKPSSLTN